MPAAVIGASIGQIGTAVAQQSLRGVLELLQRPADDRAGGLHPVPPEAFTDDGEVTDESDSPRSSRDFMQEFRDHIERVLTVLPRS